MRVEHHDSPRMLRPYFMILNSLWHETAPGRHEIALYFSEVQPYLGEDFGAAGFGVPGLSGERRELNFRSSPGFVY